MKWNPFKRITDLEERVEIFKSTVKLQSQKIDYLEKAITELQSTSTLHSLQPDPPKTDVFDELGNIFEFPTVKNLLKKRQYQREWYAKRKAKKEEEAKAKAKREKKNAYARAYYARTKGAKQ